MREAGKTSKSGSDGDDVSRDAFFRGQFEVLQPRHGAHRAGQDALLLAASIPENAQGRLADFGAGAGVAGMAVAARIREVEVDLVEIDGQMTDLATQGLRLACNARLSGRVQTIQADVTLTGDKRELSGLANSTYDYVIMNPPFNGVGHRPSPQIKRMQAHVMGEGGLDPWFRSAAAVLRSSGKISIILRPQSLGQLLAGFQGRFGNAQIMPIHSRADEPANRIIVVAAKGARAPLNLLPGVVMHEEDGTPTPLAAGIYDGKLALPFPSLQ